MIERFIIAILVPALLMLTFPSVGWLGSQMDSSNPVESSVRSLMQEILLGTQTDENEFIVLSRTAPDEVVGGEEFTVVEELRAKVDLEGAAIVSSLPEGFIMVSGDLRGFVGQTLTGESFTNTYVVTAPELPGNYVLSATARAKPLSGESVPLEVQDLAIQILEPNRAPVALFVPSPLNGKLEPGSTVVFNGTTSFDLDGEIGEYRWNLGDGKTFNGPNRSIVEHIYEAPGNYSVSLTVIDDKGKASQPKIERVTVLEESTKKEIPTATLLAIGGVTVALALGFLYFNSLSSARTSNASSVGTVSRTRPSDSAMTNAETSATVVRKAIEFISRMNLPFSGVASAQTVDTITTANRGQWIDKLIAESVLIKSSMDDIFTFTPYSALPDIEKTRVDLSFSPYGANSLDGLISSRLSEGDTIVEITWTQQNGETFTSLAVVNPAGLIKFDTFMTLDP
jgi:PKD repeat protein